MVQSAAEAHARLRALAACERRMGLAKTSWEEEERASALAYMQQGRGAKDAALAAAERRAQLAAARGKPGFASSISPLANLTHHGTEDFDRAGEDLCVLHACAADDDRCADDFEYDVSADAGWPDALSRIAQVAAAVTIGLQESGRNLDGVFEADVPQRECREGEAVSGDGQLTEYEQKPSGSGVECDASAQATLRAQSEPQQIAAHDQEASHDDGEYDGEKAEDEEDAAVTTPERLSRIRSIALGILVGGAPAADKLQPGSFGASDSQRRSGSQEREAQGDIGADAHGLVGGVRGEAEEAAMWLEQAELGVLGVLSSAVASLVDAVVNGCVDEEVEAVNARVRRRQEAEAEKRQREAAEARQQALDRCHDLFVQQQRRLQQAGEIATGQSREVAQGPSLAGLDAEGSAAGAAETAEVAWPGANEGNDGEREICSEASVVASSPEGKVASVCSDDAGRGNAVAGSRSGANCWTSTSSVCEVGVQGPPLDELVDSYAEGQHDEQYRHADAGSVGGTIVGGLGEGEAQARPGAQDGGSGASELVEAVAPFTVRVYDLRLRGGAAWGAQQLQQQQKLSMKGGSLEYKLKLVVDGCKARTVPGSLQASRSAAHPARVNWSDAFDFLVEQGVGVGGVGGLLMVKLVKIKKASGDSYPVESAEGVCEVPIPLPREGQRAARWRWHDLVSGRPQRDRGGESAVATTFESAFGSAPGGGASGLEVYVGLEVSSLDDGVPQAPTPRGPDGAQCDAQEEMGKGRAARPEQASGDDGMVGEHAGVQTMGGAKVVDAGVCEKPGVSTVWQTVTQMATLIQSNWLMHRARQHAVALRERCAERAAACFRRFAAPPAVTTSVGEELSKLRKGGKGLGGRARWFPVQDEAVARDALPASLDRACTQKDHLRLPETGVPTYQPQTFTHAYARPGPTVSGGRVTGRGAGSMYDTKYLTKYNPQAPPETTCLAHGQDGALYDFGGQHWGELRNAADILLR